MTIKQKLQEQTAINLNKDKEVVNRVTDSMFEFLTIIMREEKYEPYRIQGLGIFEVKDFIRKKKEDVKRRKEEREARNRELYNSLGSSDSSESNASENGEVDTR